MLRQPVLITLIVLGMLLLALFAFWKNSPSDSPQTTTPAESPAIVSEAQDITEVTPDASGREPDYDIKTILTEYCATQNQLLAEPVPSIGEGGPVEFFASMVNDFSASGSAEHLHFAALLLEEPTAKMALIERALDILPDDAATLWTALSLCSQFAGAVDCSVEEYLQRLLLVDSQNSEVWAISAHSNYTAGNIEQALNDLWQAAAVTETSTYWADQVQMGIRVLSLCPELRFFDKSLVAFGLSALNAFYPASEISRMCREQMSSQVSWQDACMAYGKLIETQGNTMWENSIGLSVQAMLLERQGDEAELQQVKQRQERLRELVLPDAQLSPMYEQLIGATEKGSTLYWQTAQRQGEREAKRLFIDELKSLHETEPELFCETVELKMMGQP